MVSTTSSSPSSTATSTSTSTCQTPGWFGCKDKTTASTTSTTSTTTTTSSEPTTTCTSKGWFGRCHDDVPVMTTPAMEGHAYWRTAATATQTVS
jgi:lipase ATG15